MKIIEIKNSSINKKKRQGDLIMILKTTITRCAVVAATILVALWAGFWVEAARRGTMPEWASKRAWAAGLPVIGADFRSVDHVARLFAAGRDPTRMTDDWICMLYPYPPLVNRAFGWVRLGSTEMAWHVWMFVLAAIYVSGALAAWRTRKELGLLTLPLVVVILAIVYATPAVLALERGQIDPLAIPILMLAAWLLRGPAGWRGLLAGGVLGVAAWLKYYPGAAVFGLIAMKKCATAAFVVVAGVIGVVDREQTACAIEIGGRWTSIRENEKTLPFVHATKHAVADAWRPLWVRAKRPWRYLGRVPESLASAFLLIPPVLLVSRRMAAATTHAPLILPYFLWLTAVATFAMPTSIDYALVPLPIAALAVWDRRDALPAQFGLGLLCLWWQPFALPIDGRLLFVAKLAGLYAVGACLAARRGKFFKSTEILIK